LDFWFENKPSGNPGRGYGARVSRFLPLGVIVYFGQQFFEKSQKYIPKSQGYFLI
jgi:hypothetical protein